jgi:hypothetical protein
MLSTGGLVSDRQLRLMGVQPVFGIGSEKGWFQQPDVPVIIIAHVSQSSWLSLF